MPRPADPAVKAEAVRLRAEGMTLDAIAERIGVSLSGVHLWTSPYAAMKRRERMLGRKVVPRVCEGYNCRSVIGVDARAGKRYCSRSCQARAKGIRDMARRSEAA